MGYGDDSPQSNSHDSRLGHDVIGHYKICPDSIFCEAIAHSQAVGWVLDRLEPGHSQAEGRSLWMNFWIHGDLFLPSGYD